ncbi:MAG: peptidase S9, partial [Gemmatimonadaceae bacterium]
MQVVVDSVAFTLYERSANVPSVRLAAGKALAIGSIIALGIAASLPSTAAAQYFGRNKVQYEAFHFRRLKTPHFDIYYYPAESLAAVDAARMAERWYARHSKTLSDAFDRRSIILYADHADFEQTNVIGGFIDQSTGGVTEGLRSRVVLPFTGVYADDDHVIGHELTHVFQYDIAGKMKGGGMLALDRLPLWLIEGMAEYLSLGRYDPNTAMWLRDAALRNDIPTIKKLSTDPRYFPYRYGEALWAYIGGRWGDDVVQQLYRASLQSGFELGIRRTLGMSTDTLSAQWLASIREAYLPLMQGRQVPDSLGTRLLRPGSKYGDMDVSPAVSPDGKYVAFLTSRGLLNIDLYVADAETGKIVKKLTGPNSDQHFDAISFINSAGSWSPDGKQFAFVVFADGRNEIDVFDVDRKDITKRIKPKEGVSAITDVSWGPNDKMVFAGMSGGISDLYLYDLKSGSQEQLTHDRYAQIQPTWSPDGKTVAFVTDSGPLTNLDTLKYGPMHLALMDMDTRKISLVNVFPDAKSINPQYSPDGKSLYFVSDRGGFDDIYRTNLESGEIYEVTKAATGVSGIEALSPTMSVAKNEGRIVFSLFERGGYSLHRLNADQTMGTLLGPAMDTTSIAGAMPPLRPVEVGEITERVHDPVTGLPPAEQYATLPYNPKMSLE